MENEIEQLRRALRIIHTWASVPGALDANHVRDLTAQALSFQGDKNENQNERVRRFPCR
jgi:hypothetical protein